MKRLLLAVCVLTCFVSCLNDDDNIIAVCITPTEINTTEITHISAILNWTTSNDVTDVTIEYGTNGFQLGTGTVISTSNSSVMIQGLTPDTVYQYYISANCTVSNISIISEAQTFNTSVSPVIAQFLPNLSQLNIFSGDLNTLNPSINTFEYQLNTALFTDYAHKLRLIALPNGVPLTYEGDGFPVFPNGTLMAKTFFYNLDETDVSIGKKIIETRILIKKNDEWTLGNYIWNDAQTDAALDDNEHLVKVDWVNSEGNNMSVDYIVPGQNDCIKCHNNAENTLPIGPKLRSMNFEIDGINQLQKFIEAGHLINSPDPSSITALPNWENTNLSLESRSRAYFDINCAHCHSPGGQCDEESTLDLRFETNFENTNIYIRRFSISLRMSTYSPGTSMPFIGTTMVHTEGYALIQNYLDSLD